MGIDVHECGSKLTPFSSSSPSLFLNCNFLDAPTTGVRALRAAVADLYNHTYRQGQESQYTYEVGRLQEEIVPCITS